MPLFSTWVRQRRNELGITQEELAERLNLSISMMRKIEAGNRQPSVQIASLLVGFLGIPTDEREAFIAFARSKEDSQPEAANEDSASVAALPNAALASAPWRQGRGRQTNLPAYLTPLIGREREVSEASEILLQPKVRLLTMTGAPGIGKTRLAVQVASTLAERFVDGVFWVELAPVVDPETVLAHVARTVGLKDMGNRAPAAMLEEYFKERRALLLLDNFEQVLDAAPAVVRLVQSAPWLRVLVTSRESLYVRGERQFIVLPLRIPSREPRMSSWPKDEGPRTKDGTALAQNYAPEQGENSKFRTQSLELLAAIPSVALFVERAQEVRRDFGLTEENAEAVATICTNLDGLPLAIELAAARVKHMEPTTLLVKMVEQRQLGVLTGGLRDLPHRQRTLRDAIAWSYDLLGDEEQYAFRQLGVFVGGFTPQAVDAVISDSAGSVESGRGNSLELLLSLADKNLIKQEILGPEARFGMLESIREYAQEQLAAHGEEEGARRRHSVYMMDFAEEAEAHLSGARQIEWLRRLDVDYDNMRSALLWAVEAGDGETALRLAGALRLFWHRRARYSEGRDLLASALALRGPMLYRAKALWAAGGLAIGVGNYASARSLYDESLLISQELDNQEGIGDALNGLGTVALYEGDFSTARTLHNQSLALWQRSDNKERKGRTLTSLAFLADRMGDWQAHRAYIDEAVHLMRELRNDWGLAVALQNLGALMREYYADFVAARNIAEETLTLCKSLEDWRGIGGAFSNLGSSSGALGELNKAHSYQREALAIFQEIGHKQFVAETYAELSKITRFLGDYQLALSLAEQSISVRMELGAVPGIADTFREIGLAVACQGDYDQAWLSLEKSESLHQEAGTEGFIGAGLGDKACVARCKGELERALDITDRSLAWYRSQEGDGNRLEEARLYHERGMVRWLQGAHEDAKGHLRDALRTFSRLGCKYYVACCLLALAGLAAPHSPQRAATLVGAGEGLLSANGGRVPPYDEAVYRDALADARSHFGVVSWQAAHDEGRVIPLESAVQYALEL